MRNLIFILLNEVLYAGGASYITLLFCKTHKLCISKL